jgi:hypothetical protein
MAVNTASNAAVNWVPVTDQELELCGLIAKIHEQVAGLLGHPRASRVSGDARLMHAPAGEFDKEQDVQAAQEHRVGVEEVSRQHGMGLGGQEGAPCLAMPAGCGVDASVVEDLPDGRGRDLLAHAGELAVDAPVSPGRVVTCHLQRQVADRSLDSRASGPARG